MHKFWPTFCIRLENIMQKNLWSSSFLITFSVFKICGARGEDANRTLICMSHMCNSSVPERGIASSSFCCSKPSLWTKMKCFLHCCWRNVCLLFKTLVSVDILRDDTITSLVYYNPFFFYEEVWRLIRIGTDGQVHSRGNHAINI